MIGRVRDQLGPVDDEDPDAPENPLSRHARLFDYLGKLAESLPPTRDQEFRSSEERLKLLGVTKRLSGSPTLRERLERARAAAPHPPAHPRRDPIGSRDISSAFGHLARLSGNYPNPEVASLLAGRASRLQERLLAVSSSSTPEG